MTSQPIPDRPTHGGYPTAPGGSTNDANFLLWREVDRLERSIDAQGKRMEYLDEHGSRGVDSLKGQIEQIRKDIAEHETAHAEAARLLATNRRWMIGVIVALITPLYPLLFALWGARH